MDYTGITTSFESNLWKQQCSCNSEGLCLQATMDYWNRWRLRSASVFYKVVNRKWISDTGPLDLPVQSIHCVSKFITSSNFCVFNTQWASTRPLTVGQMRPKVLKSECHTSGVRRRKKICPPSLRIQNGDQDLDGLRSILCSFRNQKHDCGGNHTSPLSLLLRIDSLF